VVDGADLAQLPVTRRSRLQLGRLQMVFQNPDETLNPSFRVGWQIARVARRLLRLDRAARSARIASLLDEVRLASDVAARMPRQLSGGQKQRVAIARAFIGAPAIVVADEPVAALDVSVRAAVVEVLMAAQRTRGTTLILISHDLALVRYLADHVVVLYRGRVMEAGTAAEVFAPPHHPYTAALLAAEPRLDAAAPSPVRAVAHAGAQEAEGDGGCPFHARCPVQLGARCREQMPAEQVSASGHRIACHIALPGYISEKAA
jgi:peptide/nickel transport system ATP-binding protein